MSFSTENPVFYDPKSHSIVANETFIQNWKNSEKKDLKQEVENWNHLNTALSKFNGDFPPNHESIDPKIDEEIEKRMEQLGKDLRISEMKANGIPFSTIDNKSLITEMNELLDLVMSKPPWEPSHIKIKQLSAILGYRCDLFVVRGQWAEAYGDAECLVIFNPIDWKSHFRKARCLKMVEKYEETKQCLAMAKSMAMLDPKSIPLIQRTILDVNRRMELLVQ